MDYRHSLRFMIIRMINRACLALHRVNTIPFQFAITRRLLPKPPGNAIVPTNSGLLLELDIHADKGEGLRGSVDRNLYYMGTYEPATTDAIKKFLPKNGVCIDVGSHNGSVALYASNIAYTGTIVAYEPVAALHSRLIRNVALNHKTNIITRQLALGAEPAKLQISINYGNRGSSSLQENPAETYVAREEVTVATLDAEMLHNNLRRLDVLKIDVEGFELPVLRGALETIRHYKPVIIIEHDPKNTDPKEVFAFLQKLDLYQFFLPQYGRHIKGPLLPFKTYADLPQTYVTNYICVPSDHGKH